MGKIKNIEKRVQKKVPKIRKSFSGLKKIGKIGMFLRTEKGTVTVRIPQSVISGKTKYGMFSALMSKREANLALIDGNVTVTTKYGETISGKALAVPVKTPEGKTVYAVYTHIKELKSKKKKK